MTKVGTDITILASAVVVLGGLVALMRALLRFRDDVRENTRATRDNTARLDKLAPVNGKLVRLEAMMLRVWTQLFPGEPPPPGH